MDNQNTAYIVNHDQHFWCLPEYQTVLPVLQVGSKMQITVLCSIRRGNSCPGTCTKNIQTLVQWRVQGTLKAKRNFASECQMSSKCHKLSLHPQTKTVTASNVCQMVLSQPFLSVTHLKGRDSLVLSRQLVLTGHKSGIY